MLKDFSKTPSYKSFALSALMISTSLNASGISYSLDDALQEMRASSTTTTATTTAPPTSTELEASHNTSSITTSSAPRPPLPSRESHRQMQRFLKYVPKVDKDNNNPEELSFHSQILVANVNLSEHEEQRIQTFYQKFSNPDFHPKESDFQRALLRGIAFLFQARSEIAQDNFNPLHLQHNMPLILSNMVVNPAFQRYIPNQQVRTRVVKHIKHAFDIFLKHTRRTDGIVSWGI